jgi:peptide/nickel transport system permease protein
MISALRMLVNDRAALVAAVFLALLALSMMLGPMLLGDVATSMNLRARNAPPFDLERGWLFVFGADALGRSILARLIVASRNTLGIATLAVTIAFTLGSVLGLVAGYVGGWIGTIIMRLVDVLMSFPSLLLALIVLYMFEPGVTNLVLVLAITRIPIYVRTTRAQVLEIRERMFVSAARALGASGPTIMRRHIAPVVLPTLLTVVPLEFALVILAESALSFLGVGIQPPDVTWGLMVAQGRGYLASAWWLAFWPGLTIMATALAANLLAGWVRTVSDPTQRWRLETAVDDD